MKILFRIGSKTVVSLFGGIPTDNNIKTKNLLNSAILDGLSNLVTATEIKIPQVTYLPEIYNEILILPIMSVFTSSLLSTDFDKKLN